MYLAESPSVQWNSACNQGECALLTDKHDIQHVL